MEASEAAPAAPAEGQVTESQTEGTEQATEEGGEQAPDVTQELAALRQEIRDRLPEEEEPAPQVPGDFYQQLAAAEFDPEESEYGDPNDDFQNPYAQLPPEQQDEEAQLQAYIREQAEAILTPHLQRQELNAFAEKHPDIREPEVLNGVLGQLGPLTETFGQAAYNPALVRMAYMAHKAEAAAAAETPAEDVGRGAVLETGGGQATPESESDPDAEWKEQMFGKPANTSVF